MSIPILDLSPDIERNWDRYTQAIGDVLKSGMFINGPATKEFETNVGSYLGVKHAIGVNSGTDALVLGLRAMDIGPGDEVICPSFTFYATAESVSIVGAKPVFADIEEATFNLDPKDVEARITDKTKAIIPVHLFGQAANMDAIQTLAEKHGLKVLEDVAQAFGSDFKGKKVGSLGHMGAFSFFPSKNLGAFGDGGLVTTDDDALADQARMLRAHGSKKKYHNELVGYNSRLDSVQAAILNIKLESIDEANAGRRQAARRYAEVLGDVKGVTVPATTDYSTHVFHQYTIRVEGNRRDDLQAKLKDEGISTMIYYPIPCHQLKVYEGQYGSLPKTEKAAAEVISLPIWPDITSEIQLKVGEGIRKILG